MRLGREWKQMVKAHQASPLSPLLPAHLANGKIYSGELNRLVIAALVSIPGACLLLRLSKTFGTMTLALASRLLALNQMAAHLSPGVALEPRLTFIRVIGWRVRKGRHQGGSKGQTSPSPGEEKGVCGWALWVPQTEMATLVFVPLYHPPSL